MIEMMKNIRAYFTGRKRRRQKGFTLTEALIAIFIFSLAVVMLSGTFSSFLKNYAGAKKLQKSIENAQYAMNTMAKTIRTSSVSLSGSTLSLYDYSQSRCLRYIYDNVSKKMRISISGQADPGSLVGCTWVSMSTYDLTAADIGSAYFSVVPSAAGGTVGKVTVALSVQETDQLSNPIQMTVSLRDYSISR